MEQEHANSNRPSVVPRSEIPVSGAPENLDLEVRPFDAHALLSTIVSRSDVALAWTHARHGQEIALRSQPTRGLLVILEGSGELFGQLRRSVEQGDVILVPSCCEYGFRAIGAQGLHALHVAFGEAPEQKSADARTLEQLLAHNKTRAQAALHSRFFALLREGELRSQLSRATLREALRVFSDAFQTILLTRQATCRDEQFHGAFQSHLLEELGHNELLKVAGRSRAVTDPVLRATSAWFCHQMLILDNSSKAIVNLCLETAGYHFHTLATPVFASDESADYFHVHAESDEQHMEDCAALVKDLHPENYRRLHRVLDDAWDMFDVMTKRMAELVDLERKSS